MRIGIVLDYQTRFEEAVEQLGEYEASGLDLVSVPEPYSFDAVSQLGYLAARTRSLELCSSVLQLYTRTPSLLAMTAAGLDLVSSGRFTLGLGASGPQVVEGFHGVPYDAPVGRMRETVEICRRVWRRDLLDFRGRHYRIPLPDDQGTGLGKPLKLIGHPVRSKIPISIAALGPKNVAMVAELAESWQPLFFHPGRSELVWGDAVHEGLAKRDPALGGLDVMLQVGFALGDSAPAARDKVRDQLALYVGGMGARGKNFYNQLARRYGYESEAAEIQQLYLAGRKQDAARAVPEELVDAVSLIGGEAAVVQQLDAFTRAGVTTLLLNPLAATTDQRLAEVRWLLRTTRGRAA